MSIEFRQVTKRYGDTKAPLVVKGIDLLVPKGTLTTILGPSGCGKTTLLRMIAGLDAPTSGRIHIDGQDVTTLGPRMVVSVPLGTVKMMPLTTSGLPASP